MSADVIAASAAAVFAFGTAIFFVLSSIERPVLSVATGRAAVDVAEEDLRFVHRALRRLIPLLPPANGLVIVGGTALLVAQGVLRGWDGIAIAALAVYWGAQAFIILVADIAADVRRVRETPSDGDLETVRFGVRRLIIQHHRGLVANLAVVVIQLFAIAM